MKFPKMASIRDWQKSIETWKGLNHNLRIGDGESYEESNMSADEYPILTQRRKRGTYQQGGNYQGLIAKDTLAWVDGRFFAVNGYRVDMDLSTAEDMCPKQLVSMGAYVIILPDKKYINTSDLTDWGNIEARVTVDRANIALCDMNGGDLETIVSDTEPGSPTNGQYWVDTGSNPNALRQWSDSESMWVSIGTSYAKISYPGIGEQFGEWDGVQLSGWESADNPAAAVMGSQIIWARDNDYIVITGIVAQAGVIEQTLTIERTMPVMDFVIESGNRLWGCRYGMAANGKVVNEIYASKLGDFKNWNSFIGLSTDSWVGNLGSDGEFTGAAAFLGYPVFFKADHIHRVYGNLPSQYTIKDTVCRGVQKGSERSIAQINECLIYKSRTGVCLYDGSLPQDISGKLGSEGFTDAVAGSHGSKYYISMLRERDGEPELYCYDMSRNLWHKEDSLRPECFCSARNELYCIADGKILSLTGAGEQEADFSWETVTGEIGLMKPGKYGDVSMPEKGYIRKLMLRMSMEPGARAEVLIEYDGSGVWIHLADIRYRGLDSFAIPILPRRSEWLRLKIRGKGKVRIYTMTEFVKNGSEDQDHGGMVLDF